MAPPKGNRFWEARAKHGRGKIFSSPEVLWESCCEYFKWVEDNPLYETKAFHFQGKVITEELPKMRAMTIRGLCTFLGVGHTTWHDYRAREDFSATCAQVESIIHDQKFSGAAADLLNASIIARDLGLTDKKEVDQNVSGSVAITVDDYKAAEAAIMKALGDDA